MKKYLIYFSALLFLCLNVFASCEEEIENKRKIVEKHKIYAERYTIYETTDSSYTGLSIYELVLKDGHKYRYSIYDGKNKCQMDKEHLIGECKKCNNKTKAPGAKRN